MRDDVVRACLSKNDWNSLFFDFRFYLYFSRRMGYLCVNRVSSLTYFIVLLPATSVLGCCRCLIRSVAVVWMPFATQIRFLFYCYLFSIVPPPSPLLPPLLDDRYQSNGASTQRTYIVPTAIRYHYIGSVTTRAMYSSFESLSLFLSLYVCLCSCVCAPQSQNSFSEPPLPPPPPPCECRVSSVERRAKPFFHLVIVFCGASVLLSVIMVCHVDTRRKYICMKWMGRHPTSTSTHEYIEMFFRSFARIECVLVFM